MKCGLVGRNITYSRSPIIHNSYYKENNLPLKYEIFDVKEEELTEFIKDVRKNNIIGFNVTVPYKEQIINYLSDLKYPADRIMAVNTVLVTDNGLIGYNTDYDGFIRSLNNHQVYPKDNNALIIGGGGSAKCVYYALENLGAKKIDIMVRNIKKCREHFGEKTVFFQLGSEYDFSSYDLIVNCTPLGGPNYRDLVPIEINKLKPKAVVFDLNYIPDKSKLLSISENLGAKIINGYDMLVNQAYSAIDIWIKVLSK